MKAIILAAGVGSRLRPMTDSVPKTLVEVGGKPILAYQIEALLANGVEDIVVCTGHLAGQIESDCKTRFPGARIIFVENTVYDRTNNMYSLYLAREHLRQDILLMNADVCFEPDAIAKLLSTSGSAVAVDTSIYNDESMKVVVTDRIVDIAKTITEADAFGCSIDVYKFEAADVATMLGALVNIVEVDGEQNQWTEVLLQKLFQSGDIVAVPCDVGDRWLEIDDNDDLNAAEKMFNPDFAALASRRIFFFDRDGTVSLGKTMIDGAAEAMERLKAAGIPYYVLTNNSSRTTAEHYQRMKTLPVAPDNIVVSTDATIAFLKAAGTGRIHLSATASVADHFRDEGFTLVEDDPEAVVLTYNNELTYAGIIRLLELLRTGVPYYATHIDRLYPYEGGFLPDIGAIAEMIAAACGRHPDRQFGKPSPAMVEHVLKKHGLSMKDAVVVGDRLYTDVALAEGNDMLSVLVLTGETRREHLLTSETKPDVVLSGVGDIAELFS